MNASYKIALVVAVGLLILVAGYYATRGDAKPEPANEVSNAVGDGAVAQGEPVVDTPADTASRSVEGSTDTPNTRHGNTRPDDTRRETPGRPADSPATTEQPTRTPPAVAEVPAEPVVEPPAEETTESPIVDLGPPPASLPGSLAAARDPGPTEGDTAEPATTEPPADDRSVSTPRTATPDEPEPTTTGRDSDPEGRPEPVTQPERPTPPATDRSGIPATYTVEAGDMLVTIAERFYGSQNAWEAIAQANPTVDPTRLRVGQQLRMPRLDAVERPRTEAPASTPGQRNTYTVSAGDNLYRIAERFYNDAEKWDVIYNHNRDAIGPDPAKLKLGMTLVIPPAINGAD